MTANSFSSMSCFMPLNDLSVSALSLDPEQKDQLIEVIEKLLADKTTVGFCTTDPVFFSTRCVFFFFLTNANTSLKTQTAQYNQNQLLCTAPDCIRCFSCFQAHCLFNQSPSSPCSSGINCCNIQLKYIKKIEKCCRIQSVFTGFLFNLKCHFKEHYLNIKCAAVGGGKRCHGFRGGVSGAHRPDPQELQEAV